MRLVGRDAHTRATVENLCRCCQLSIKTAPPPKQRGGINFPRGSWEVSPTFNLLRDGPRPGTQEEKGRVLLGRSRRRSLGGGEAEAAAGRRGYGGTRTCLFVVRSGQVLTWRGAPSLTAARRRENPFWFHEAPSLGLWKPPLAARILVPTRSLPEWRSPGAAPPARGALTWLERVGCAESGRR